MDRVWSQAEPLIAAVAADVVAWRRHLHQHPELSFHEVETARFVADTLASFEGLAIERPTPTSVVARLHGAEPGRVLALRADIDALPIAEENPVPYRSRRAGVMHACGHDGHTAMLLGAAKVLCALRHHLRGEVRFIFQHAEEVLPGGAQELVEKGVLAGVDLILGAHLWSPLALGRIGVKPGALMAAPDTFRITIHGKGGHAALPHETIDPILVGAQVVTALHHIVSRRVDPLAPFVVSVTRFAAGTADNVVPETAELTGTVRTFDPALRDEAPRWMEQVAQGVAAAYGASCDVEYRRGYHPVINDEASARWLREVLEEVFGPGVVVDAVPTMGGEDFSAYQQQVPGVFFFIGVRDEAAASVYPHHHPRFNIAEAALPMGVKAFVAAAVRYLGTADPPSGT
ncbi:N-acyl-L-amino acid amidohydrolase [Alicyclobacillus cellulosilyticus]|uniref:N-acyl-L-amino acid amidohydrolase n=1 Tax=Alicyclobacillus cellulosilyticus TaxID=1003997 RepID=A0A917KFF9_9BACL|nr:N-acyl-L-amino acid amidohydrolase [Alicyclobacillus cellulosilyticus]